VRPVVLLKLGGSLITEKDRPDTARPELIARLAGEIARAWPGMKGGLVLGHGSGSFGHAAARALGLYGAGSSDIGRRPPEAVALGAPRVQARAAALHSIVMAALQGAELPVFSVSPGSASIAAATRIGFFHDEPFALALSRSLLPVTYGDVVLDRERGAVIFSTETVLVELAGALLRRGWPVARAIWLGETDGIYDADGRTVSRLSPSDAYELQKAVGGSAATDVTGGMAHRLDAVLSLARLGIRSWIGDGRPADSLFKALVEKQVGGTVVTADA